MPVRIADAIWRTWQEQLDRGAEPAISMLLTTPAPADRLVRALDEAVSEAVEGRQTDDGPWRGEWSWVRVGGGVVVKVLECDELDVVLNAVVEELERRGIADGTLDVHETALYEPPPPPALVESRLRIRGAREHVGGRTFHWKADSACLGRAIDVALRWCAGGGATGPPVMKPDDLPAFELHDEGVAQRTRELAGQAALVEVRMSSAAGERRVVVEPFTGRVSLIDTSSDWRAAVAALTDALRDASDTIAYALMRHGEILARAVMGDSLIHDWPPRPGYSPDEASSWGAAAFEDSYAPDAFAVQLLGPGYAGRLPAVPSYRVQPVGDCTLLTHVDQADWFHQPFVPPGTPWYEVGNVPAPAPLAAAREELAPLLFEPEAVIDAAR